MNGARLAAFVGLACLLTAGCDAGSGAAGSSAIGSDVHRVEPQPGAADGTVAAVEAFAADLYAVLARDEGNLVVSPYSIAVALAMARTGAVGETADQMDAVLHAALAGDLHTGFGAIEQQLAERPGRYLRGADEVELELSTANQLWGQHDFPFEQAFLDHLARHYGAGVMLVDFVHDTEASRVAINDWVAERTRDRIPELIPEGILNALTRLVLTNAIYLNAPWSYTFAEQLTAPAPFYRLDGRQTQVDMMQLHEGRVSYTAGSDYEAVELPYVGSGLSMVIVVPERGRFASFEARLDGVLLREVVDGLQDASVTLRLPRFEFRSNRLLRGALSELGMPIAFTDDADFSGMSPQGRDLRVEEVVHEAFISVDEYGTEAAAATAVIVGIVSAPTVIVDLTVDRPFLFFVRDRDTGAILFLGRVVEPEA